MPEYPIKRYGFCKEEPVTVDLLHWVVPARYTDEGLRAIGGDIPIHPESVETYLKLLLSQRCVENVV
jgi:hypothetical protein